MPSPNSFWALFGGTGIHVWRWRALALWIVMFTALVAFALRESQDAAHKNKALITRIQRDRVERCLDINARHDKTVRILRDLEAQAIGRNPQSAPEIHSQFQATVNLVDALTPVRPCTLGG